MEVKQMQNYFIPGRYDISTEVNGKVYNGYYTESKGMITVHYNCHSETTQKSSNNDVIAEIILGELVRKYGNN